MNDTEREAIILNSAWDMIDGMVNWAIFDKTDRLELSNLWFPDTPHRQLFLILLSDFLSQTRGFGGNPPPLGLKEAPSDTKPSNLTYLFHLRQVCADPILGRDTSALSEAVEACATWLETEFIAPGTNLHDIELVVDIRVSRLGYIKICGDYAKHNLARLETNNRRLKKLISIAGHDISESQAYLAMPTFNERFADDIFIYHASHIAELLNNIRWEIYRYLQPEFRRAYHRTDKGTEDFPMYGYHVPPAISEPIALAMYWDAMNRSRSMPYVQQFSIPGHCKTEY